MRSKYWSCSKFADWLRGENKLNCGTSKEWCDWEDQAQTKHPIRFWLAEEGLDHVQKVICSPIDGLYSVKYWINNRFVTKTHALTSSLKKGQWHELDTRMLHCLFDELVDHVEIEIAGSNFRWSSEARKKFQAPFWAFGWFRWRTYRNIDAAMDYLEWASNLRYGDNDGVGDDEPLYGKLTRQALAAIEIRELYNWWKNVRPLRPDPHDASGWTAWCDRKRGSGERIFSWLEDSTPEESAESSRILDLCNKIEQEQEQEDEDMMIRLIRIRHSLWT